MTSDGGIKDNSFDIVRDTARQEIQSPVYLHLKQKPGNPRSYHHIHSTRCSISVVTEIPPLGTSLNSNISFNPNPPPFACAVTPSPISSPTIISNPSCWCAARPKILFELEL